MKKILLENAYVAWQQAVEYRDYIKDGLSNLYYKKQFVGSLQNSIELFLKQIMIDNNDKKVIIKNKSHLEDYDELTSLNDYLYQLPSYKLIELRTVNFSEMLRFVKNSNNGNSKHKYFSKIKKYHKKLEQINHKRNYEKHFYIDDDNFLKDKQFVRFNNFMFDFYEILVSYKLLPYFGKPNDKCKRVFLGNYQKLDNSFTYCKAIKSSNITKYIVENINNKDFPVNPENAFSFAMHLYYDCGLKKYSFKLLYDCVCKLNYYGLIKYDIDMEDATYLIKINIE